MGKKRQKGQLLVGDKISYLGQNPKYDLHIGRIISITNDSAKVEVVNQRSSEVFKTDKKLGKLQRKF